MGVKQVAMVVIPVLLLAVPGGARGGEIRVEAPHLAAVVVYPDRAEVTRRASVTVPAGAGEIVFEKVPPGIERDSLRVSTRGVPALIGAVELREQVQEPPKSPEYAAADDEVRRLEVELAGLDAEDAADKETAEFLRALRATTGQRAGERLAEGRPDPEAVRGLFEFVRAQVDDLGRRLVTRQERRKAAQERLQIARARRDAARPRGPIRTRTVRVALEARQAGALDVTLGYVVPGARWRPAYRAVLDAEGSRIAITSEAVVVQRTGEDWDDVELQLSTSAPARGVQPPALSPVVLRVIEARSRILGGELGSKSEGGAARDALRSAPAAPAAVPPKTATPGEALEAEVVHTAYNTTFVVPGRSSIAADGRDHRVVLRSQDLAATLGYRIVPAAREDAYVVAKATAPADYPLLAGPMRVFAGAAYVGQFALQETGPGAELELPFGADNRVRVKRVVLTPRRTREGLTGRDEQVTYVFRTEIENLRGRAVTVVVEDQVPVSEDERITVKRGDGTTPGFREVRDRPGVLEWDVPLGPRQKKEIVLEYAVRHPKDLPVAGAR